MRQRLFMVLSALSLLLCVATLAMWIRSHSYNEGYCLARSNWGMVVHVDGGQAALEWMRVPRGGGRFFPNTDDSGHAARTSIPHVDALGATERVVDWPSFASSDTDPAAVAPPALQWHGFAFCDLSWKPRVILESPLEFASADWNSPALMTVTGVALPLWAVALLTGIFPVAWSVARLRRRRAPGQCRTCGYDLRASPDRCPECGAIRAPIP